MIARFSLYSALKNQRFFEPFFMLAMVEKGLSFSQIGGLIALRETVIIVMEIPSGAVADVTGRRRALLISVAAYCVAFALIGLGESIAWILIGMGLIGFGDSFRTGAHKAMIYRWLANRGETGKRTRTYSITRSWGKVGSAASVVIAAGIVAASGSYSSAFLWTIVPYVALFALLWSYPSSLESDGRRDAWRFRAITAHLRQSLAIVGRSGPASRLVVESAIFEGVVRGSRDYLQPLLALTVAGAVLGSFDDRLPSAGARVSVTIGVTYVVLFLLAAASARLSSPLADRLGQRGASRTIWLGLLVCAAAVGVGDWWRIAAIGALGLIIAHVLFEAWRPVMLGRLDDHVPEALGASVLSIESLARRVSTAIAAPLIGWAIDALSHTSLSLWPISAAIGAGFALALVVRTNDNA